MTIKIERHEDAGGEMVAHYDIRPLHYAKLKRLACAGDDLGCHRLGVREGLTKVLTMQGASGMVGVLQGKG